MTDTEITRACAEAMGLTQGDTGYALIGHMKNHPYNPLHNDAQAMALVKKFRLNIGQLSDGTCKVFRMDKDDLWDADSKDMNRAICETVAKLQKARAGA